MAIRIVVVIAVLMGCGHQSVGFGPQSPGARILSDTDCVLRVTPVASVFDGAVRMEFSPGELEEILIEEPIDHLGYSIRWADDPGVPDANLSERSGIGLSRYSLRVGGGSEVIKGADGQTVMQQRVPPYAWTPVAVSDGEGAGVVSPGRYRVVIRYLPDETFSGDHVCVAVSPPFELVIPEGAEFTIVPFPRAEQEEGHDDV